MVGSSTPLRSAPVRRSADPWARPLLTTGWAVVGVVVVVSAVDLLRAGWAPVLDNALIAAMTVDSISLHPPLVGMPTSLGLQDGVPLSHPGPLGFWLLAVPTKALGAPGHGLVVGATLVALLCLAGSALLLRRRGDRVSEALALALTAAMVISLGGGVFASPFNPHLGILPLQLCLLATWGVLAGRHRQLWVMVPAGSLAAQVHLGYVPLVVALVALVAVSLAVDVVRSSGHRRRRLVRRVIPIGALVGLLAWSGPIVDQLFGTGNLARLARSQSTDRSPAGIGHGLDVAVEMTSLPPRWLLGRARDQDLSDPSAIRVALSLAAAALVGSLLVWAVRRRHRPLAGLTAVAAVSVATATLTSARIVDPTATPFFRAEDALLYRVFWWPVGSVFALAVLWGSCTAVTALLSGRGSHVARQRSAVPILAGLVGGIALVAHLGYTGPPTGLGSYFDRESAHAEAIAALPGSPHVVLLRLEPPGSPPPDATTAAASDVWDLGPHQLYGHAANLVAQLRLRGITVRFDDGPDDGIMFMRAYRDRHRARGDEPVVVIYKVGPEVHADPPPPGYRRLSVVGAGPGEPFNGFTVPSALYVRS